MSNDGYILSTQHGPVKVFYRSKKSALSLLGKTCHIAPNAIVTLETVMFNDGRRRYYVVSGGCLAGRCLNGEILHLVVNERL